MPKPLSNHEIVTLAVYLLGGDSQHIDTEDVAIKANEIAPGRFSWRKYPDQISIANVSKRLWDAMNSEKGGYLIGSERKGWLVTESGLRFAKERMADLDGATQPRKTLGLKETMATQ
jgi:phospholipase C